MPWYSADLHVHSCLSPCGSLEASPSSIARSAADNGIDLLALTDHNSARNCPAFKIHAAKNRIEGLFGLEASSAEDIHCLGLFPDAERAYNFGEFIYKLLTPIRNDPDAFGDQVYVDEDDSILGELETLLIGTTSLGISELVDKIQKAGGLAIPAHTDRGSYSCLSQLGYVPPLACNGLEIVHPQTNCEKLMLGGPKRRKGSQTEQFPFRPGAGCINEAQIESLHSYLAKHRLSTNLELRNTIAEGRLLPLSLTASSDAHEPEAIGKRRTVFWADKADFSGLAKALDAGLALGVWLMP